MFKVILVLKRTEAFKVIAFDMTSRSIQILKDEKQEVNLKGMLANDDIFMS